MTDHKVFKKLAGLELDGFKDKPTSLTEGQQEASSILWTSADGHCKIECGSANRDISQRIGLPLVNTAI